MPTVQYDPQPQSVPSPKPRFTLPRFSFLALPKLILTVIIFIAILYLSAIISGFISALSSNVTITALSVVFDPQITIAYILTYYFLSHFYDMPRNQMYTFFILTLFLSFTVPFIQGAITLMLLPIVLRKLRLIAQSKEA